MNTVDDLIRLLDEAPQSADDLRSRILSRDLLDLPAQFAKEVEANNQRFAAVEARLTGHREALPDSNLEDLEAAELLKPLLDSLSLSLDNMARRLHRYERDIGLFRSRHAREVVRERSGLLATELGYRKKKTLTTDDLCDLVDNADTRDIETTVLRSFRRADLVVEAVQGDEPCYLAVEISFTVDDRDTQRAIRNARLLNRFTGMRAHAVVAGVRKDRLIDSQLDARRVSWFELEAGDLETE